MKGRGKLHKKIHFQMKDIQFVFVISIYFNDCINFAHFSRKRNFIGKNKNFNNRTYFRKLATRNIFA